MRKSKASQQSFNLLSVWLVLAMLIITAVTGLYLLRLNSRPKPIASKPNTLSPSTASMTTQSLNEFDIEAFYSNLQIGMTPEAVIKLANKQPDDCAMTGSIPASQRCYWYSGNKTVAVSYGNKSIVQAKNKTGF